ncbi:hypothetical protein [Streptomyces sp. NPDC058653]|uniref:hypothetical protein n=1 Tax=Streptomyces sp. NPDC058653 TaxID=3346576 RepID=UPI00366390AB
MTAGSLSLLVTFARYSRDGSFAVLGSSCGFALVIATSSVAGVVLGGMLLDVFSSLMLVPRLAVPLLVFAIKLARHKKLRRGGSRLRA